MSQAFTELHGDDRRFYLGGNKIMENPRRIDESTSEKSEPEGGGDSLYRVVDFGALMRNHSCVRSKLLQPTADMGI